MRGLEDLPQLVLYFCTVDLRLSLQLQAAATLLVGLTYFQYHAFSLTLTLFNLEQTHIAPPVCTYT